MIDVKFSMFFDREGVKKKVKDGSRSVMSKAGAFVRRRAKGLIRPGKKAARPGNPPHDHGGWLKKLLFFGYDSASESVIVGPKLFSGAKRGGSQTVPQLLEGGGTTTHWRTAEPATYRKFPFMKPALDAERDKFPTLFADAIK